MAINILILAGDTDGNLGDLAIVTATCSQLRRLHPGARISLVTGHPQRDRQRLGIEPIPRGLRGLPGLLRAARSADLIVCGGGGLFQDDDSLMKMPYWALRLAMLRIVSKRIAGLAIGAGPLAHYVSRRFAALAVAQLDPVSVRDEPARQELLALTNRSIDVIPDPAFLLEPADASVPRAVFRKAGVPDDGRPLVGVSLRRWFHNAANLIPYRYAAKLGMRRNSGQRHMAALISRIAATLDQVHEETGAHIIFMPTYNTPLENDVGVCDSVAREMRAVQQTSTIEFDDPAVYKAATGLLDVMLCGRLHSGVLAAGMRTPIIGISYNQKFSGTFALLGQQERCVPITTFANGGPGDSLLHALLDSLANPERFRPDSSALAQQTRDYIRQLTAGSEPGVRRSTAAGQSFRT